MTTILIELRTFPPACSPPPDVVRRFCQVGLGFQVRGQWRIARPGRIAWQTLLGCDLYLRN